MVKANIEQAIEEETNHNGVTLVVPSNGDAIHLHEFTNKVKQVFGTRILSTIGSWTETSITIEGDKTTTTANIVNQLVNMPEVETVEEKQVKNQQTKQEVILVKLATP